MPLRTCHALSPSRWLKATLPLGLLGLFSCAQAGPPPPADKAGAITNRVRLFLIAPGAAGKGGRRVGCGDSVIPVEVNLSRSGPALEGALAALVALDQRFEPTSGLYNPLYGSRLQVKRVERNGPQVRVDLTGYLEIGGECDAPRILAQLQETVLQFQDVEQVQFFLEGKALPALLGGPGS